MLEFEAMTDSFVLDILFLVCALLLLPIGFRRGANREVFVTAGVLAGATLSNSWARPWGEDLADLANSGAGTGRFVVSAAFVVGATVLFGYLGAAAAGLERPELRGRFAGAVLAVINGAIFSAILLRSIEIYLSDPGTEHTLKESAIAWTLLRQFGWVVFGGAVLMCVPIVFSIRSGDRSSLRAIDESPGDAKWTRNHRGHFGRKRGLGWGDDGKIEPVTNASGTGAGGASLLRDTMAAAPVDSSAWSMDRAGGRPPGNGDWIRLASSGSPSQGPTTEIRSGVRSGEARRSYCTGCGELMRADDAFCPRCGRAFEN